MKTFREHLSEEVMPSALVADGSIDIQRDAVRDNINALLDNAVSCHSVTPYNALMKVRKVLSYFAIHLPKKAYMEGKHGVEVWEVHQFGDRMGMTDQGEFVKSVPCNYYLFFHYHLMGSMYMVRARLVDKAQLDKELDIAETMIKEDAAFRQNLAKATAPKEDQHTALGDCDCSQGDSPSTKQAVDVSMRRKDKKLSAGKLDETRMPASIIRRKQKLAAMSPEEKAKKFAGKSKEELEGMARRHGYGKGSNEYSKHVKEETLDELSKGTLKAYKSAAKADRKMSKEVVKKGLDTDGKFERSIKNRTKGIDLAKDRLEEKLTKGMKVSDVISDFVHSDDPKFKGKSKKERMKMALGAYYGMHPEKSRKE